MIKSGYIFSSEANAPNNNRASRNTLKSMRRGCGVAAVTRSIVSSVINYIIRQLQHFINENYANFTISEFRFADSFFTGIEDDTNGLYRPVIDVGVFEH